VPFVRERELDEDLIPAVFVGEVESFLDGWSNEDTSRSRKPEL
jgi:hypothetical protein